jgi:hypothetical protein
MGVVCDDVGMNDAKFTQPRFIAADANGNARARKGFLVVVEFCSDDWDERSDESWVQGGKGHTSFYFDWGHA